jgi:hypothetical protein
VVGGLGFDFAQFNTNQPFVARIIGLFTLSILGLSFNICAGNFWPFITPRKDKLLVDFASQYLLEIN